MNPMSAWWLNHIDAWMWASQGREVDAINSLGQFASQWADFNVYLPSFFHLESHQFFFTCFAFTFAYFPENDCP